MQFDVCDDELSLEIPLRFFRFPPIWSNWEKFSARHGDSQERSSGDSLRSTTSRRFSEICSERMRSGTQTEYVARDGADAYSGTMSIKTTIGVV